MRNDLIFRGAATALITPFNETGVDFESYGRLIDWQIEEGINALVIAATTGEGATLSDREKKEVLDFAIRRIDGRVPAIAGTGSNNTVQAMEATKFACAAGYDGMLVVTPYYNKATQKGLVESFKAIAEVSSKPIIVYNVPSRTGVNIEPSTYAALTDIPGIAGMKEANGNISKIVETVSLTRDKLTMYSGNDDQIVPLLSMGAQGVISVLANVVPRQTVEICDRFFAGDIEGSAELQCRYLPLVNALFSQVNPIPVKAAMAAMGFCENRVRLPLTVIEPQYEAKLLDVMRGFKLI